MAYIILPSRRTRQPQGAVRVAPEWNKPGSIIWTPSVSWLPYNSVDGKFGQSNTGTPSVSKYGRGLSLNGSQSTTGVSWEASYDPIAGASALTFVAIAFCPDPNVSQCIIGKWQNAPFQFELLYQTYNIGLYTGAGTTTINARRTSDYTLGTKEDVIAVSWPGGGVSNATAVVNGISASFSTDVYTDGTPTTLPANTANTVNIGGSHKLDGTVTLVSVFPFAVPVDRLFDLSANPWQLFAPDTRRIYFGASGGGATIITSSGAASLVAKAAAAVAATKTTTTVARSAVAGTAATTSIRFGAAAAKATSAGTASTTTIRTATISAREAGTGASAAITLRTGLAAGRLVGGSTTTYAAIVAGAFAAAGRTSARGTAAYTSTHAATAAASATTHGEASATTLRDGIAAARLDARAAVTAAALVAGTVTTSAAAQIGARASVSNTTERSAALAAMLALRGANPAAPELPVIVPPSTRSLFPDHARLGLSPVAPSKPRLG